MIRPVVAPPPMYLNKEPWLREFSLAEDNGYVDLTFSEEVFSAIDTSSAVGTGYFEINFTPTDSGHATDVAISTLTKTNGAPLSGGEETIRVRISLSNPPATGLEVIEIRPYNNISICKMIV